MALSPAVATAETISTARTTEFVTADDVDHTITSTGSVAVDPTAETGVVKIDIADYTAALTNDGVISGVNGNGTRQAGIEATGNLSGTIDNAGQIDLSANPVAGDTTRVEGISVDGEVSGTVDHSGVLNVTANGSNGGDPTGNRLFVNGIQTGDVSGTLNSSGTITLTSTSTSNVGGTGIETEVLSGTFTSTGDITIVTTSTGTGSSAGADGNGIQINNGLSGVFENHGNISITSIAVGGDVNAQDGIEQTGDVTGSLLNTGNISMLARNNGTSVGSADGVELGDIHGSVRNDGMIDVEVEASRATVDLFDVGTIETDGAFVNNGALIGLATAIGTAGTTAGQASIDGIETRDVLGSFANTGDISVEAVGISAATADGLDLDTVAGTATNTGAISAIASSSDRAAEASGMNIEEVGATGTVQNDGTITVEASAVSRSATATGIVVNTLDGRLTNNGTITATGIDTFGTRTDGYARAFGFDINTLAAGSQLTSNGSLVLTTISDSATSDRVRGYNISNLEDGASLQNSGSISLNGIGNEIDASGFYINTVSGTLNNDAAISAVLDADDGLEFNGFDIVRLGTTGVLINSGSISAELSADGSTSIRGSGFSINTMQGTVQNSGDINLAVAAASSASTGYLAGFRLSRFGADSSLTNAGDITLTANASGFSYATATGIDLQIELAGTLNNSGTITVVADSSDGAVARALSAFDITAISSDITNTGNLLATASGGSSAAAIGVEMFSITSAYTGTFENTGNIQARVSGDSSGQATGMYMSALDGIVSNSGDITAIADSNFEFAEASGVRIGRTGAASELTISGDIIAVANGSTSAEATGIYIGTHEGTLSVSGDISATGNGTNYAINLDGGSGTLNIVSSSAIDGIIRVGDHDVNLSHTGESAVYVFEDEDAATGAFDTTAASPEFVWAIDGAGTNAPVYAAVNGSDFVSSGTSTAVYGAYMSELMGGIDTTIDAATRNRSAFDTGFDKVAGSAFVRADVTEESDRSSDDSAKLAGLTGGYAGRTNSGHSFSIGASLLDLDGQSGNTDLEASGILISGTYGLAFNNASLTFGLGIGRMDHSDTRSIAGSQDALAEYTSTVAVAALDFETDLAAVTAVDVNLIGGLLAGIQDSEGYTETGSLANATVPDRTNEFAEASIGLKLTETIWGGLGWASLEAVHSEVFDTDGFDVSVFGTSVSTGQADGTSSTNAKLAVGFERSFGARGTFTFQASASSGQEATRRTLAGAYKFAF
ncbi:hypothetical protein [Cognatiyoonia sp. IB215182]|uniref:beta strand repeat-containing protein n=1 Tax=Cognatiyoonia sp. IB215182 TaxID=3097353 RepID=UPI002A242FF7|nr:hypothetical protein [Cognatiyoonia sp. IB215182]